MRKLKLEMDALTVQSFDTVVHEVPGVRAHARTGASECLDGSCGPPCYAPDTGLTHDNYYGACSQAGDVSCVVACKETGYQVCYITAPGEPCEHG